MKSLQSKLLLGVSLVLLALPAMTPAEAQVPQPSDGHQLLKKDVGTWKATMKSWMGMDGSMLKEPTVSQGKEVNRMMGELWLIGDFSGEVGGMKFQGHSVMGYDAKKDQVIGSWVDSLTPTTAHMTGKYDKKTNSITYETNSIGMDGKPTKGKSVQSYEGDNKRVFTMYNALPGKEEMVKVMEITYVREK